MNYQNHLIDPTFFWDAIDNFAFDYTIYTISAIPNIDDYGNTCYKYDKSIISGSLQSDRKSLKQSKSGNTTEISYKFYCKSLYKINIGDIIEYNNRYLRVDSVQEYDEFGVREASLQMINITDYQDFADYIKYREGEKPV